MHKELVSINKVFDNSKNPVTCIIGGSKISTKINVLINLIKKVDNIIIVGAMANNFIKYNGINTGKSLVENNSKMAIEEIYIQLQRITIVRLLFQKIVLSLKILMV